MDLASPLATPAAASRKAGLRRAICICLWPGSSSRLRRKVARRMICLSRSREMVSSAAISA